jgi:hypothetical protein
MNYSFENPKNVNFVIYKEIGELIKSTKLIEKILNAKYSPKTYAFIAMREFLIYSVLFYGQQYFYLPQHTNDLTLYLDNMGIALKKKSTEMISTNCM